MPEEVIARESISTMAEACPRCATEFLLGSRFCHACGARRPEGLSSVERADAAAVAGIWQQGVQGLQSFFKSVSWSQFKAPSWLSYLHFHEIKNRMGLSTGSLVAFVIGLACVASALLVGLLTAKTLVEWQAIQFYRAEWLLAATAAFVAGILLKKQTPPDRD
jgi:hypothetical protein